MKQLAAALLLALPAWAMAAPAEDLLSIYAKARAADPQWRMALERSGAADAQSDIARAALLPQWQLQASAQRALGGQGDGWQRSAGSQINQVIVDLAALKGWDAAQMNARGELSRARAAEQALAARVAAAYFGVLAAQTALASSSQQEAAFAEQLRQTQARFDAGLAAQVDVEQTRAFAAAAQGARVQAARSVQEAQAALAELTGEPPGAMNPLKPLRSDLPATWPEPREPEAWVARGLAHNPLLLAQQDALASASARASAAEAAHWPTLGLSLATQRAAPAPGLAPLTQSSLALTLTVPLFSGGATEARAREAAHLQAAERLNLEATQRAVERQVHSQWQAVAASIELMGIARASVEAADKALAATRAGQQHGTRGTSDVLMAIQTLAAAQGSEAQARHQHVVALLLLKQAAGSLAEADLAAANALLGEGP